MLFVIFGTYREIPHPICYAEEEHTASRLVDLLAASDLTWEHVGYSEITEYRDNNEGWDYPFSVEFVTDSGIVNKPPWINFTALSAIELARRNNHETSREREGGILPASTEYERLHYFGDPEERRERYEEDLRSRMRRRSRINRAGDEP